MGPEGEVAKVRSILVYCIEMLKKLERYMETGKRKERGREREREVGCAVEAYRSCSNQGLIWVPWFI